MNRKTTVIMLSSVFLLLLGPIHILHASDLAQDAMFSYYDGKIENLKKIKGGELQNLVKVKWQDLSHDLVTNPGGVMNNCIKKYCGNYIAENVLDLPKDRQALAQEAVLSALEVLVEDAVPPIKLLLTMNDIVYGYTQGMLDFYSSLHHQEFTDEVLKPAENPAQLTQLYDEFMEKHTEITYGGGNSLGDKDKQRKDMEAEYKQVKSLMEARERKIAEAEAASAAAVRAVKRDQWEIKVKILNAENFLKLAKQPVTEAGILRYINDKAYAAEVSKKGEAEAAKNPPVSGDTPLEKALVLKTQYDKPLAQAPDYSPVLREYGLNSDRLLTNNVTPEEYGKVKEELRGASAALNARCAEAAAAAGTDRARTEFRALCSREAEKYSADTAAIDKRLDDYAAGLKTSLEALTMGGAGYGNNNAPLSAAYQEIKNALEASQYGRELPGADSEMYAVSIDNSYISCAHIFKYGYNSSIKPSLDSLAELKNRLEGSTGRSWTTEMTTLEKMKENRSVFQRAAATYAGVIQFSENKAGDYAAKAEAYKQTFLADSAKYAELYQAKASLAAYYGIKYYDFAAQLAELDAAEKKLNKPDSLLSQAFRAKAAANRAGALKEVAAWDESIKANEAAISGSSGAPEEIKALVKWTYENKPVVLDTPFLQQYYDRNFKGFILDFLQDALVLLDDKVSGCVNTQKTEYARYGNGSKSVLEIEKGPANISLADHSKKLEEFGKKLEELKALDLEGRRARAAELVRSYETALARVPVKCTETVALGLEIADAYNKLSWGISLAGERYQLYYGDRILTQKLLQAEYDLYAGRIEKAQALENERTETYKRIDEAGTFTLSNVPDELLETVCWKDKWKPSNAAAMAWGSLIRNRYDRQSRAVHKDEPFNVVTIAGKRVSSGSDAYELGAAALEDGKVVVRGELHKDAPAFASVSLTLRSSAPPVTVPVKDGAFEYAFVPEPGKTYNITMKAEMPGLSSRELPSAGRTFDVTLSDDRSQEVRDFYDRFKAAYESRNAPQVLALISDSWTAGDGTELADLEENLRNNFRLYDEIKYAVTGLTIQKNGGAYKACYDVAITSRIYKRNLRHEEKSQVCDELSSAEGGRFKIARTSSGTYWYVK